MKPSWGVKKQSGLSLWIGTLPLSCWSTSTNRSTNMNENATYSADVCTKMKTDGFNSQLDLFFSSDVIESYTKLFGEAGTIYLHPVNTPWKLPWNCTWPGSCQGNNHHSNPYFPSVFLNQINWPIRTCKPVIYCLTFFLWRLFSLIHPPFLGWIFVGTGFPPNINRINRMPPFHTFYVGFVCRWHRRGVWKESCFNWTGRKLLFLYICFR